MKLVRLFGYGGGKGAEGRIAREDKNSLRSKAYAHFVDLLSEGPIEGFCTEDGITIRDAKLNFAPDVNANGSFVFTSAAYVKEPVTGVVLGRMDNGVYTPIVDPNHQGYPFHPVRRILAEIYVLAQTQVEDDLVDPTPAVIQVHTYPRTAEEKEEYLAGAEFDSVDKGSADWHSFVEGLKIYPEGKIRGLLITGEGKNYSRQENMTRNYAIMVPRASSSAIYFDGIPCNDPVDLTPHFQDIGIQYRLGYEDQSVMPGFTTVDNVYPISSPAITYEDTIKNNDPWDWQFQHQFDYDRVIINIQFPNGLYYQDLSNGDVKAIEGKYGVQFSIYHSRGYTDDNGNESWTEPQPLGGTTGSGTFIVQGKTMSSYERSYDLRLAKQDDTKLYNWKFFIRRLTPDDPELAEEANSKKKFVTQFNVSSMTAVTEQKYSYPFCALVGIRINAEQFNSIPTRSYRVKLARCLVPDTYFPPYSVKIVTNAQGEEIIHEVRQFAEYCRDPETGEGVYDENGNPVEQEWTGGFYTSWTNNPAWIAYTACTDSRFGMGKTIPNANKWMHYKVGRYCDEYGPYNGEGLPDEARFTCNVYFQARAEAFKVLTDLASVFAGYYYYAGGSVIPVQDAPRPVRMHFNTANVKGGIFNYQGTQRKVRHTVAMISYSDPKMEYKQSPVYVEDHDGIMRYGYQSLEKTAFGTTVVGQARRFGRRLLRQEISNTDTVSFTTGVQGCVLRPGDIIAVYDPVRSSIPFGGRVIELSNDSDGLPVVITDREIPDETLVEVAGVPNFAALNPEDFLAVFTKPTGEKLNPESSEDLDVYLRSQLTDPIPIVSFSEDALRRRILKLATPLPPEVVKGALWGMQHANVKPQYFSVLGVEESSKHEFNVSGIEYHEEIYDEIFHDEHYSEEPINPNLDYWKRPGPPRNLVLKLTAKKNQSTVVYTLQASWDSPEYGWAKEYKVYLKRNLGNFQFVTDTQFTHVDIPIAEADSYTIRVFSVGITNILSEPAEANIGYLTGENAEIVSGLEINGQGNDNTFYGTDLNIDWRVNWSEADSSLQVSAAPVMPATVESYILRLYDPGSWRIRRLSNAAEYWDGISAWVALNYSKIYTPEEKLNTTLPTGGEWAPTDSNLLLREYTQLSTDWSLSLDQNKQLLNGPYREMVVEVRARTNDLKLSVPTRIRVSNPVPPKIPTGEFSVVTSDMGTFNVRFLVSRAGADFSGYRVWASLTNAFVPSADNLIWEGNSSTTPELTVANMELDDTIYIRVAEYDRLSKSVLDCLISDQVSVTINRNVAGGVGLSIFEAMG